MVGEHRSGWVHLGPEKYFPKPHRMLLPTGRALEGGSRWGEKRKKRAPGKDGWTEEAERSGRKEEERAGTLFLCGLLLAPQESLWAGKEGSMSWRGQGVCPEDTTPHQLLPKLASGWAQAALATNVSASLLGSGFSHQGPAAKALLRMPTPKTFPAVLYPTAVFKLTPVSPTPCFRLGLGQHPTASLRVSSDLWETENALLTF